MIRKCVQSTNVRSVGFDNDILEVEFLDGSVYQYLGVPMSYYLHMVNYSHPGTFLSRNIKGRYRYRRVS